MKRLHTCLITTVGVSLIYNLKKFNINLEEPITTLAKNTSELLVSERMAAELSSIDSILRERVLDDCKDLYLLVTDTSESKLAGNVLKEIYFNKFKNIHIIVLENLNNNNAEKFRDEGLRNLVKAIVQIYLIKKKASEKCVINATGGYKATVSLGTRGQVPRPTGSVQASENIIR